MCVQLANRLRRAAGQQLVDRGNGGVEVRIVHNKLLLTNSVAPERIEREALVDAIVEYPCSGANDGLGSLTLRAKPPGNTQRGRKIAVIAETCLQFVPQPEAHRDIGACPPIIQSVQTTIKLMQASQRIPAGNRELAGAAA